MKFFCNGTELSEATNTVSKAVASNKNIPILEGIKISAVGKTVTLSAFDEELYIEKKILADIHTEGEIIVSGKLFNDYVNKISNHESIGIELDLNNKIKIYFGKNSLEMNCYDSKGFASLGEFSDKNSFKMKQGEMKELFDRCIFCSTPNSENYQLVKNLHMEVIGDKVQAYCLDGMRMALNKKPVTEVKGEIKCSILAKTVNDLIKILNDGEEEVKVILEKRALLLDAGYTKIRIGLMSVDHFDYNAIIPVGNNNELIVNKNELNEALNRVSIISRESHNNASFFTIDESSLNITCENEKGRINENIECKYDGAERKIYVKNKYIQEAISRIKEDFVKIIINEDKNKPIIVTRVDEDDYICIILIVRNLGY